MLHIYILIADKRFVPGAILVGPRPIRLLLTHDACTAVSFTFLFFLLKNVSKLVLRGKRKKFCPFHDKNLYMHGISVQYLFLYGSVHYLPTDIKYMYMRLV